MEKILAEQFELLRAALHGRELNADDLRMHQLEGPYRSVNAQTVRTTVDAAMSWLREMKGEFGKR